MSLPRTMCRLLLDAALKAADPEAPYGAASGSTDLTQATVLLHGAGQPLRPFDRFECRLLLAAVSPPANWMHLRTRPGDRPGPSLIGRNGCHSAAGRPTWASPVL